MNLWITGGAGFIGSAFVLDALRRYPDRRVVNVDKLTYAANLASLAGVTDDPRYRLAQVDIADADALERLAADEPPIALIGEWHIEQCPSPCTR